MEIEKVRVQNYKSVLDTGWVDIERDVTTLVGANEAGKTNFLEALSKFKDGEDIPQENLTDYGTNSNEAKSNIPIVSIYLKDIAGRLFDLDYGGKVGSNNLHQEGTSSVILTKFANGSIRVSESQPGQVSFNNLSEEQEGRLYRATREELQELRHRNENLGRHLGEAETIDGNILDRIASRYEDGDFDSIISFINNMVFDEGEVNINEEIYALLSNIRSLLRKLSWSPEARQLGLDERAIIPDLLFFNDIEPIPKRSDPHDSTENADPYHELLDAVDMDSESLSEASLHESHRRRDEANDRITQLFDRHWNQADVQLTLTFIDNSITLRIYEEAGDGEDEIRTLPSDRSQGFRWFLSFFCHLLAKEDGEVSDSVILLDDPGAFLHPKGHKDLQQALAELGQDNQILYSTHSPYMIDKNHLNRVRTVRQFRDPKPAKEVGWQPPNDDEESADEEVIGTIVTRLSGVESPTDDSLHPVRMALGATHADSLFASKHTILVEGPDDRTYLKRMSELLGDDEPLLDDKVNFLVCGGASKADYLARIVDSENYNATVVLDDDQEGRNAQDELAESKEEGELDVDVYHTGEYVDIGAETTIEDMLSPDLLCEIAAEVHSEVSESEFRDTVNPEHGEIAFQLDGRLKQELELDDPPAWVLDKKEIARVIDNRAETEGTELFKQETLDRFEELLQALNASLNLEGDGDESEDMEEAPADD